VLAQAALNSEAGIFAARVMADHSNASIANRHRDASAATVSVRVKQHESWHDGPLVQAISLCLLVVVVYLPALRAGFIWNDDSFLTENPLIHASDGLHRFWASTEPPDYFPLTSTSLWLEWRVFGDQALGYHVVSLVLHATSAVLLWLILKLLRVPGAWLAAAIFAVHPVNVESVAWITERKNTLSMVFFLCSALAYLRFDEALASSRARWKWYACSLVALALALTAKTSTVVLPVLLLIALALRRRLRAADLVLIAPHIAMSIVFGLVTVWFQSHRAIITHVIRDDGMLSRTAIAARAVWFYACKALVPADLCFVYPRWQIGTTPWVAWLPLAALLLAVVMCVAFRRTWGRVCAIALCSYVIALAPALGFIDIYFMRYSLVSDHWQYIAMTVAAATIGASVVVALRALRFEHLLGLVAGPLILGYSVASWRQLAIYANNESLWTDTLAKNPSAWIAHNNLADDLLVAGRSEDAVPHFRAAAMLVPDDVDVRANLGKALLQGRHYEQAAKEYEAAIRMHPERSELHDNLGNALQGIGKPDAAIAEHTEAIRLDPARAEAHSNLANAYAALSREDDAIAAYRDALRVRPTYAIAHNNLAAVLERVGRKTEALDEQREAVRCNPASASMHVGLARMLRDAASTTEAIGEYRTALRLAPRDASSRVELAECLCAASSYSDAATEFDVALNTAPADSQVAQRAAWFFATVPSKAFRDGRRALSLVQGAMARSEPNADLYATLAAAYAELGSYADAVRWQSLAVPASSPDDIGIQRARLDRYRRAQGQPR
jgi:tetratricopeptide (TPR) repeat protein